jgi:hypothetical protein
MHMQTHADLVARMLYAQLVHDVADGFIGHELPQAVSGNDDAKVLVRQLELWQRKEAQHRHTPVSMSTLRRTRQTLHSKHLCNLGFRTHAGDLANSVTH